MITDSLLVSALKVKLDKRGSDLVAKADLASSELNSGPLTFTPQLPASLVFPETKAAATPVATLPKQEERPREWSGEARAANIFLGHSMEYLADSRDLPTGRLSKLPEGNPDTQAMAILLEAKRQVYLSCPLKERRKNTFLGGWKGFERRRDRQN